MRTYNATAERLEALAYALREGSADPEEIRLKLDGRAEMVVVRENTPETVRW